MSVWHVGLTTVGRRRQNLNRAVASGMAFDVDVLLFYPAGCHGLNSHRYTAAIQQGHQSPVVLLCQAWLEALWPRRRIC